MRRLALVLVLVVMLPSIALAASGTSSSGPTLKSILAGKTAPLSLKLRQLDGTWRRFTVPALGEELSLVTFRLTGPYFTRGDTIKIGEETFLIAYRYRGAEFTVMGIASGAGAETLGELTPETEVWLCLLNLRELPALNEVRPFDLQQEMAEYKQMVEAAVRFSEVAGGAGNEGDESLKQLALAVAMYATDWDALPPLDDPEAAKQALAEYVPDESVFTDPRTGQPYATNAAMSGVRPSDLENAARTVIFYQAEPGADGKRGVAFADGHAERVSAEEWEQLRQESRIP